METGRIDARRHIRRHLRQPRLVRGGFHRISKRWELGTYCSWFIANWPTTHSLPTNHVYDKDVTARFDVTRHWNVKIEGHFMNGYGAFDSIRGFYGQQNPSGLKPDTTALVVRTGLRF